MIGSLFWLFVSVIVYVHAGYPALLALLVRLFGHTQQTSQHTADELPSVTLLIAAYNEEAIIAEKLDNSLTLDYPPDKLHIVVAADGSNDRTLEIVRGYANKRVTLSYSPPRHGKMAAINRAMQHVQSEIVVFSDANNMYTPSTLRELVQPFSNPTVGAVGGAKIIMKGDGTLGSSEGFYWKYESFIKQHETRLGCCIGGAGEILAIRCALFELPPDNIINDDFYLAMRIVKRGYRMVYAPNARSYERVSASAQDEVARRSRIIAGRYQAIGLAHQLLPFNQPRIVWQVVSHKFLRPLIPLAMFGALITNIIAVFKPPRLKTPHQSLSYRSAWLLAFPFNWLVLLLQVAFYAVAWRGNHKNRSEHDTRLGKLLYLPTFLVNSNMASLVGLYRFVRGKQTTRWQRVKRRI